MHDARKSNDGNRPGRVGAQSKYPAAALRGLAKRGQLVLEKPSAGQNVEAGYVKGLFS
jgi:hypothetical protein